MTLDRSSRIGLDSRCYDCCTFCLVLLSMCSSSLSCVDSPFYKLSSPKLEAASSLYEVWLESFETKRLDDTYGESTEDDTRLGYGYMIALLMVANFTRLLMLQYERFDYIIGDRRLSTGSRGLFYKRLSHRRLTQSRLSYTRLAHKKLYLMVDYARETSL